MANLSVVASCRRRSRSSAPKDHFAETSRLFEDIATDHETGQSDIIIHQRSLKDIAGQALVISKLDFLRRQIVAKVAGIPVKRGRFLWLQLSAGAAVCPTLTGHRNPGTPAKFPVPCRLLDCELPRGPATIEKPPPPHTIPERLKDFQSPIGPFIVHDDNFHFAADLIRSRPDGLFDRLRAIPGRHNHTDVGIYRIVDPNMRDADTVGHGHPPHAGASRGLSGGTSPGDRGRGNSQLR